jgi:hypothetical protein
MPGNIRVTLAARYTLILLLLAGTPGFARAALRQAHSALIGFQPRGADTRRHAIGGFHVDR